MGDELSIFNVRDQNVELANLRDHWIANLSPEHYLLPKKAGKVLGKQYVEM